MRPRKTGYDNPIRCENCRYFRQHYVKWGNPESNVYRECDCGHCVQDRLAKKTVRYFVCDAFVEKKQGNSIS